MYPYTPAFLILYYAQPASKSVGGWVTRFGLERLSGRYASYSFGFVM